MSSTSQTDGVCDIGSRRELFADDWLIERQAGLERRLHHPVPAEVALTFDEPWEGPDCCYVTVFRDTDRYRMYYSCYPRREFTGPHQYVAYAESDDGVHWRKPCLHLVEFQGSRANNLVLSGTDAHTFAPFIDPHPDAAGDLRCKAVGGNPPFAFASGDGLHWRKLADRPLFAPNHPAFARLGIVPWDSDSMALGYAVCDSHNLAFWDRRLGEYVYYFRGWVTLPDPERTHIRTFFRSRSRDFLNWADPEPVEFSVPPTPLTQFYTNGVQPYFRAPHLYVALPMRFASRPALSPAANKYGIAEAEFMFSRDGLRFERYMEPFLRPGPDCRDWTKHNNMLAWGMLDLVPEEISLYYTRHHFAPTAHLQRAVLRADGFVSLRAPHTGGEFTTRPLLFAGERLEINVATGIAGSLRVELQDAAGRPLEGFDLAASREFYGDEISYTAEWNGSADIRRLAGRPVRLRFRMQDADLFALRFAV